MRSILFAIAGFSAILFSFTNGEECKNRTIYPGPNNNEMEAAGYEEEGRLYNGLDAFLGQIPYQAYLEMPIDSRSYVFCGGTIISNKHILTAAHCIYQRSTARVFVGLVDLNKKNSAIQRQSSKVISHPGYRSGSFNDDIGVIEVSQDIPFSQTVNRAVLPTRANADPASINNIFVLISGWGGTGDDGGYKEDHSVSFPLKYANVKMMSYADCQATGAPKNNMCTERKTVNAGPCPNLCLKCIWSRTHTCSVHQRIV